MLVFNINWIYYKKYNLHSYNIIQWKNWCFLVILMLLPIFLLAAQAFSHTSILKRMTLTKQNHWPNVTLDIPKKIFWICICTWILIQEVEHSLGNLWLIIECTQNCFLLLFSPDLNKVHTATISLKPLSELYSSNTSYKVQPCIRNCPLLKALLFLSERLKSTAGT
jgi:hypothetical protein